MNRRAILKWLGLLGLGPLIGRAGVSWGNACSVGPSTAVFYERPIPDELVDRYERLIVEADAISSDQVLLAGRAEPFLYISIGEAEPWRAGYETLDPTWFLGRNEGWGGNIVDLTQPGWLQYILEVRIWPLWARGYRGFFLDTLDSFRALPLTSEQLAEQEVALNAILRGIYERYPTIRLILNRGFDLWPSFGRQAVGVVAESLLHGWDAVGKSYFRVQPADHAWLLAKLETARDTYGLPVTVIDYLPLTDRAAARHAARRIRDLGFTPWVTAPQLNAVGIGLPDLKCS
ncbi:endo alpha-1,4 polygalactosaminidase [Thiocystis violacea]|uniref:endo alpha-1,4 polygalactosaminidase n=1 Tax=Thiocystis violacea TaxID=13725 RepID=UPI001907EE96|nr:endo alpha-1,4 polygalactosaminidase [Thiocystis violacea]MBK1723244.1 hypothetical protein [Thiocystis violacea]